jgi:hypothetical protein
VGFTKVQQKNYYSSAAATTHTISGLSTPTQNNLLLLPVTSDGIITTPTGWTKVTYGVNYTDTHLYYKIAGASEPTSVAIAINASTSLAACFLEYSGNIASPLDKSAANVGSGTTGVSTWATGTTAATAQADELVIASWGWESATGQTPSYSGGFVELTHGDTTGTGTNCSAAVAVLETSASGTQACTITITGSGNFVGGIATFKAAPVLLAARRYSQAVNRAATY